MDQFSGSGHEDNLRMMQMWADYLDQAIKDGDEDMIRVCRVFKIHCARSPEERETIYRHLRGVTPPRTGYPVRDRSWDEAMRPDGTFVDPVPFSKIKVSQRDIDIAERLKDLPDPRRR